MNVHFFGAIQILDYTVAYLCNLVKYFEQCLKTRPLCFLNWDAIHLDVIGRIRWLNALAPIKILEAEIPRILLFFMK